MANEMQELIEAAKGLWEMWNMTGPDSTQWDELEESDRSRWLKMIAAARKASEGGWIEIKPGCEMPKNCQIVWVDAYSRGNETYQMVAGYFTNTETSGFYSDGHRLKVKHWRSLPSPPLSVEKPKEGK
jgi:hypothetical protein